MKKIVVDEKTLKARIGFTIKTYRGIFNLTQAALAEKAGVTPAALCFLEKGQTANIVTLSRIATVFNVPLSELIRLSELDEFDTLMEVKRLVRESRAEYTGKSKGKKRASA